MAKQNQSSNKKGMNTVADAIDHSSVMSELERIGARAERKSIQRTEMEEKIRAEGKLLNQLYDAAEQNPSVRQTPFFQEQEPALRASIKNTRTKMNSLDTAARTRAESETSTYIARQFTPTAINREVTGMQRSASVQNRAFSMSGKSYDELEAEKEEVHAQIRLRERSAQNEVKGMFSGRGQVDPDKSSALNVIMSGSQDQMKQLAAINAAQAFQKASGQDPNSKMRKLAEMGQVATNVLSAEGIAQEVRAGGVQIRGPAGQDTTVANKNIEKEIVNQSMELAKALKQLSEATNATEQELNEFRENADRAAENLDKLKDARGAVGAGNSWNAANVAMGLAGGFNALGAAGQQIMVNQRMQETANITGFANLANQEYDMYKKARGGDIASQLMLSQLDEADQFGMEMKRGTNAAQTAFLAGGAAQAGAGMIQMAEGGAQKFNPGAYIAGTSTNNTQAIITGAQNTVQGLSQSAVLATDMAKGVSGQSARLAGIQAQKEARMAINAIGAEQAQGLRNFYTDLDVAGQGMGGRANAFLTDATGQENLARMSEARMSPEQFAKMAQLGSDSMGSTFDKEQIFAARNLESRGFGSMQTNMQRMATLASAGANNPKEGMEGVLSAAVAKGLDTSKSINMMVDNTAAMVSTSAGAAVGIDTTQAASSMLASSVNTSMANKEMAVQQAMNAAQITKEATTNRDVSFTGMANTAGLQSNLAKQGINIGGVEALSVQGVDMATLKTLQKDPKKAAEFFQNKGVNITENNAGKFLETVMVEKERQILRQGGLASGFDLEGLRNKVNSKEGVKAGSDEFRQLGQIAELQGRAGGAEELIRELKGVKAPNVSSATGEDLTGKPGADDIKKQLDALRTGGFKQLSDAAGTAAENLKKFGGAIKVFTDLQKGVEEGGAAKEAGFTEAASKMATEFSASTGMFKNSVSDFSKSVEKLSTAAGLLSNGIPLVPNQFMQDTQKHLDRVGGSKKGG